MDETYFILGGLSIFESQVHFFTTELDKLAQQIDSNNPDDVEFHASTIFARRIPPWNSMKKEEAIGIMKSVLSVFKNSYSSARAFACAIHKPSYRQYDFVKMAYEDLSCRFDSFLGRLKAEGDTQKGQIILDKSSYELTLQNLAKNFRTYGTQWKTIRNLADVPFFVNSKSSRVVQIADHIAYAVFRRYNTGDTQFFDIIASRFDADENNILHGLSHKQTVDLNCMCPACISRKQKSSN